MIKPFNHVGKLANGNPFVSLGDEWCSRCKMIVDTDTEASHRCGLYTYKRWCLRCGKVLKYGVYGAPLVSDVNLGPKVVAFVTSPEKDRR